MTRRRVFGENSPPKYPWLHLQGWLARVPGRLEQLPTRMFIHECAKPALPVDEGLWGAIAGNFSITLWDQDPKCNVIREEPPRRIPS